jgi:hypothetical protein
MRGPARRYERINASVPLSIEGGEKGETLNVSPGGIYFVMDGEPRPESPLRLTLEFENAAGKLYLECVCEIVRVDRGDGQLRVAARITDSRLQRSSGKQRQGAHA